MQQAEEYAVRTLRSGITPIVLKFQPVYDCYNGEEIAYIGKPLINSLVYGVLTPELYARAADMALDIRADELWRIGAGLPRGEIYREAPVILP